MLPLTLKPELLHPQPRGHRYVEAQKEDLPPEHLRKIIKDHGDMVHPPTLYPLTLPPSSPHRKKLPPVHGHPTSLPPVIRQLQPRRHSFSPPVPPFETCPSTCDLVSRT